MNTTTLPETTRPRKSTKKRVRNFSSEDRAAHRIFERGRREAFKERLIELAGHLPVLADMEPKHLSKHIVVDESIARHRLLESRCVDALRDIRSLVRERDELLAEVNTWRRGAGTSPRQPKCAFSLDSLVETEKQFQQRALSDHLDDIGRCSFQNGPSEDSVQIATILDGIDVEKSHCPQIMPTAPTHNLHAPSDLDSLLLYPSWPDVTQAPAAAFPTEPPTVVSDQVTLKSNAEPDSLPMPTSNVDDYQAFADVGLHRQMPLLSMGPIEFSPPDTGPSAAAVPISSSYLFATNLDSGVSLHPSQQWASWHGVVKLE